MDRTRQAALALVVVVAMLAALGSRPARGQAPPGQLRVTINPGSISFPDRNPDIPPPYVTAVPATIQVRVRVRNNGTGNWQVTLAANDHLRSGPEVIPATAVSWVTMPATPPWTPGGTLTLLPGQLVASGQGDVQPDERADLEFRLANLWTHPPGFYTTTATFTLSAP